MADSRVLPGARIRTAAGIIGIVERLEHRDKASREPSHILVRERHGDLHYRFPLQLVRGVDQESEQSLIFTVVHIEVADGELGRYLVDEVDGFEPGDSAQGDATSTDAATIALRIPLVEEQLLAETRPVRRGTVHLHKGVETHEEVLLVPIVEEDVIVERIPADRYDASAPLDQDETVIPVFKERIVVEIRTEIAEYVRVRKKRVTRQQEVRGAVRREVVTMDGQPIEEMPPTVVAER